MAGRATRCRPAPGCGRSIPRKRRSGRRSAFSACPRLPLCGLISQYNATEPVRGPDLRPVLVNRVSMRGFIVSDHTDRQADFLTEMTRWVREARVRYREDVVDGLEQAPRALIGLLEG